MSKKIENPQTPEFANRPTPPPEQALAFRGVYSHLMQLSVSKGQPIRVEGMHGSTLNFYDAKFAASGNKEFLPNGAIYSFKMTDRNGGKGIAVTATLTEESAREYGVLARLEVGEEGAGGSHPADVYWLYLDRNIEHIRRTKVVHSIDEEGYEDWDEENTHLEWLDPKQMEELQLRIEGAEPSTVS